MMEKFIQEAAKDIMRSKYVVALTGAGISTESGIPDFRGPNGIWTKNPEAEKKAYQSYERLQADPKMYWEDRLSGGLSLLGNLAKMDSNPGHYALAELEKMGRLKCVITQNIDNLHLKAGSQNVLEYHGNVTKLRCMGCNARFSPNEYDLDTLLKEDKLPPLCKKCDSVIKSDVVHFGEAIPPDVAEQSLIEAAKCDLMLICGTSAVVYPFAMLPQVAKESKPEAGLYPATIIEVNAEPTPLTTSNISDCLIQGKTGDILPRLLDAVKEM